MKYLAMMLTLLAIPTWAYQTRVVQGNTANYQDWPFITLVEINTPDGSFLCGGSYIGNNKVVTAAHCVIDGYADEIYVGYGDSNIYNLTVTRVTAMVIHPQYSPLAASNDIAVLWIENPGSLTAINVAESSFNSTITGEEVEVAGWGVTDTFNPNESLPDYLQEGSLRITDLATCQSTYGALGDWAICAYDDDDYTDACQGDSGGPLIYRGSGVDTLVGVVSFGDGCGKFNTPGVYANVSTFSNWVASASGDSSRLTRPRRASSGNLAFLFIPLFFGIALLRGRRK